jgi:hypothetical protein
MAIYTCDVPGFEGEVEIDDHLNYPQLAAYERGMISAQKVIETNDSAGFAELRLCVVPGLIACVKAWRLKGVPERVSLETFPSTPKKEAGDLYLWLLGVVRKKIDGEDSGPK